MPVLQFLHALFLRLYGAVLILFGIFCAIGPGLLASEGVDASGLELPSVGPFAILLGVILLVPWWLPRGLRRPSGWRDVIWFAPILLQAWLIHATLLPTVEILGRLDPTASSTGAMDDAFTAFNVQWYHFAGVQGVVMALLIGLRHRSSAPAKQATPSRKAASGPAEQSTLLSVHRALVALSGVAIATTAAGILLILARDAELHFMATTLGAINVIQVAAILGILGGLSLLLVRMMPRFLARPTRWYHFVLIGLYLSALAAIAPLTFVLFPIFKAASQFSDPTLLNLHAAAFQNALLRLPAGMTAQLIGTVANLSLIVTTILLIRRLPTVDGHDADELRPYSASTYGADVPEVAKPVKDRAKAKLPEPKLPSIGAAMKLYIVADWLVMRLLGAGLLWTGYLLFQMIQAERWSQAAKLSYGQDPMHALYAYGLSGALLAVPFLLPRRIVAPRSVLGGLFKAVILLAACLVLLPMLDVAITTLTPDIYHATLQATMPSVFKAVAGVAVTSALLISFFRQLGATPQVDYTGKPVVVLSERELRELREARMNL